MLTELDKQFIEVAGEQIMMRDLANLIEYPLNELIAASLHGRLLERNG